MQEVGDDPKSRKAAARLKLKVDDELRISIERPERK
jgi:hypothetical protein